MKYFNELKKEIFADYVNGLGFQITNPGPLHAPGVHVSIRRNKDLDIILEHVLAEGAVATRVAPRPGEVTMVAGTVELKSLGGITATATGIAPMGTRPQWNEKAGVFAMTERASLNAIEIDLPLAKPQAYLVDRTGSAPISYVVRVPRRRGDEPVVDMGMISDVPRSPQARG